eukprot:TRINITY_DN7039_c1_g5_i1.p1 TRINITY_DN7039_c1_g5~~TRINITY_DN7039_c1_g5_i1.p1  ORF type:complete len:636 (-),score=98.71 TRINITY_DN7039_c1_g5_i1:412-2292(-)
MAALTVDTLRSELEMFANLILRDELVDLAGLIKKELRTELQMFHASGFLGQIPAPMPDIPGQVMLHPEHDMDALPRTEADMLQPAATALRCLGCKQPGQGGVGSDLTPSSSPERLSAGDGLEAFSSTTHIPKPVSSMQDEVQEAKEAEALCHTLENSERSGEKLAAHREIPHAQKTNNHLLCAIGSEDEQVRVASVRIMPGRTSRAHVIVNSFQFELFINVAILLNAVFIGVVTDYLAKSMERNVGPAGTILELLFMSIFIAEVCLKFAVHRFELFRLTLRDGSQNRLFYWNAFDFSVIFLQLLEVIFDYAHVETELVPGISIARILRILRMVRLIRAIKLVGLFSDLRNIVHSVTHSLSLFVWSVVALLLVTFLWSVLFMHLVWDHRLACLTAGIDQCKGEEDLKQRFGTLARSVLSLLMAVTGGIDWGDLYEVLNYLNAPMLGNTAYLAYVLFAVLALQNVITGIFFDTASRKGKDEAEFIALSHARGVFASADRDNSGKISREDFEEVLEHKHVESFFEALELRPDQGAALFDLLDASRDGSISSNEFFVGCLKVRGQAKALDLLTLSREVTSLCEANQREIRLNRAAMEKNRLEIKNTKSAIDANRAVMKELQAMLMSTRQS